MNFRHYEALYWIGRLGSFHAAARHLHTSQAAISVRIRDLERQLGVVLFERVHDGVEITGSRQIFYARLPDVKGTAGGVAFLLDEVMRTSPAYRWTLNHTMRVEDPMELFPVHMISDRVEFAPALAIKFTLYRERPSGSLGDGDIFGSQQYGPLLGVMVPDAGG